MKKLFRKWVWDKIQESFKRRIESISNIDRGTLEFVLGTLTIVFGMVIITPILVVIFGANGLLGLLFIPIGCIIIAHGLYLSDSTVN